MLCRAAGSLFPTNDFLPYFPIVSWLREPAELMLLDNTATAAKLGNFSSSISDENNAISCSSSQIGSLWLPYGLLFKQHERDLVLWVALLIPVSHETACDCKEQLRLWGGRRKESVFSHVKLRSHSRSWACASLTDHI